MRGHEKSVFGAVLVDGNCAINVSMPNHQTSTNLTFTEQAMNWYHEVNEMYDGTLNSVHHFMYATNIASNDSFTFHISK